MRRWLQLSLPDGKVQETMTEQEPQRPDLSEALRAVIADADPEELDVKRIEINVGVGGDITYRLWDADMKQNLGGTVNISDVQ